MKVSSPRNEVEALRAMATMKSSSQYPFSVTLYVPNVPEGSVRWALILFSPLDILQILGGGDDIIFINQA